MPPTPSLLRLIGRGFEADEYAADGIHLRWMFDPALGFPWFPWCLERRPSLGTEQGRADVEVYEANLTDLPSGPATVDRSGTRITRDGQQVAFGGFALLHPSIAPVDVEFRATAEPAAAWARVSVQLSGSSNVTVEAYQRVEGEMRLLDRASASFQPIVDDLIPRIGVVPIRGIGRQPLVGRSAAERATERAVGRLRALLADPPQGAAPPRPRTGELQRLHDALVAQDADRYAHVSSAYLRDVAEAMKTASVALPDLAIHLPKIRTVDLDVFGDHIDFVRLSGSGAVPKRIRWVHAESLVDAKWERVDCFSALTDQPEYVDVNKKFLPDNQDVASGTEQRLADPLPRGAEPMDDPQVPPSRPPTLAERMARYGIPWIERLEPWLDQVFSESLPGDLHQSEITIEAALTEFGQKFGDGIPALPAGVPGIDSQTQTIEPYGFLLASSMAFPTAQLLGLATVDVPPDDDVGIWDYRITGLWRMVDLVAYIKMLQRRLQAAQAALAAASPADLTARLADLAAASGLFLSGLVLVQGLAAGAVEGLVRLTATVGGLSLGSRPRFTAPASLQASFESLSGTGDPLTGSRRTSRSVSHLEWPMPERREQIEAHMALMAALGRRKASTAQPFSTVLNPADPDFGVAGAIVPANTEPDDDGIATADFFDRAVESGSAYTYGVTHADPFGRWSSFAEVDYSWTYDVPPIPPYGVAADLDEVGNPPALRLTTQFRWPIDLFPPEHYEFSLYLSRTPVPAALRHDPAQWTPQGFSRTGGPAPALRFAADFDGSLDHDGMPVQVSFTDESETDDTGAVKQYRRFRIRARGVQLNRVDELARCWVAVRSHDVTSGVDGTEMAGPDLADHYSPVPPPPPEWPPEPLESSIADADGFSTFDLSWSAAGSSVYEVFRVGERDLVAHLSATGVSTTGYDADDPDNLRAAALKALAADPASRQAFGRRSELAPGVGSHRDRLPGYASTLYLYVVLTRSPSGVPSSWPSTADSFLAVRVPRAPLPARPVVASARWRPAVAPGAPLGAGDRVELLIVEPPADTAAVAGYEVYRTTSVQKSAGPATMRLLHRLVAPTFEPADNGTAVATYIDPHIDPWTTYFYRVVARAPGSNDGLGMRSEASAPARLTSMGTGGIAAPTISSLTMIPGGIRVAFTGDLPTTPVGDTTVEVLTVGADHQIRHIRVSASSARVGPGQYEVDVDPSGVPAGAEIVVRVTDPAGSGADSPGVLVPAP